MGRRKRGADSTIASNKVFGGSKTNLADMSAASGRRMAVAGAIGEKFTDLGANVRLGLYTISHPLHPLQRVTPKRAERDCQGCCLRTEETENDTGCGCGDAEEGHCARESSPFCNVCC